jgi:7,8-dihydroneopterin aldolase/epimerase/oxygenase
MVLLVSQNDAFRSHGAAISDGGWPAGPRAVTWPLRSIDGVNDIVSIRDLRVTTVIGVYDWEREIEQALTFSVDMAADVAKAAASDDLRDALDYSAAVDMIKCVVIEGKFQLIETAAERVAQRVLAEYGLAWVRVQVVKPITSEGYSAAITIERGARPARLV